MGTRLGKKLTTLKLIRKRGWTKKMRTLKLITKINGYFSSLLFTRTRIHTHAYIIPNPFTFSQKRRCEQFKAIGEAYAALSDPAARRKYNAKIHVYNF